jgi:hypothetical protein
MAFITQLKLNMLAAILQTDNYADEETMRQLFIFLFDCSNECADALMYLSDRIAGTPEHIARLVAFDKKVTRLQRNHPGVVPFDWFSVLRGDQNDEMVAFEALHNI